MISNFLLGTLAINVDTAATGQQIAWQNYANKSPLPAGFWADLSNAAVIGNSVGLELEVKEIGGTAPGVGKTLTVWTAFASVPNYAPAEFETAAVSTVISLATLNANSRQVYQIPIVTQQARYFYVAIDNTTLGAGCKLLISARLNTGR